MDAASRLAERLAARTLELVDIPSVSRAEGALAAHVRSLIPSPPFELGYGEEDTLLYLLPDGAGAYVLLAGHLDTVPAQENLPGRLDGGAVVGLGASDMKGGLAVMIELARWIAEERPELARRPGFLFFPREELPASESPLPRLFERGIGDPELVIVLEPTDNAIQVGCLGNVSARLVVRGVSAHSARPWLGVNAIERAVERLRPIVGVEPSPVEVEGHVFTEVLSATRIAGGLAGNVIPDRVEVELNFRFAPGRTPDEAERRLRELVGDDVELLSISAAAHVPPAASFDALRAAGNFAVEPKQAWTPVAQFSEQGLDAVNLGPGATRYAHARDERVEASELARTFLALQRFLLGSV